MISYIRGEILYTTDSSVGVDVGNVGMEVNVTSQTLSAMEWAEGIVEFYTYLHVKEDALTLYGFSSRKELKLFRLLITVSGIGPKSALGILSQISCEDLIAAVLSEDSAAIAKTPGIGAKSAGKIVLELKDKLSFSDMLSAGNTDGILHAGDADGDAEIKGRGRDSGSALGVDRRNGREASQDDGSDVQDAIVENVRAEAGKTDRTRAGKNDRTEDGKIARVRTGQPGAAGKITPDMELQEHKNEAIQALTALGYSVSEAMKAVRSIELAAGMSTEDILKLSLKYL